MNKECEQLSRIWQSAVQILPRENTAFLFPVEMAHLVTGEPYPPRVTHLIFGHPWCDQSGRAAP